MRKMIIVAMTAATLGAPAATLVVPAVASASNQNQVTSPQPGTPGCFGQWRAGSMQALKDGTLPGYEEYKNGGALISSRATAGDLAAQNAADHATCDAAS